MDAWVSWRLSGDGVAAVVGVEAAVHGSERRADARRFPHRMWVTPRGCEVLV